MPSVKTKEDCFKILEIECQYRKTDWYLDPARKALAQNQIPDTKRDYPMQNKAIRDAGFATTHESVREYRRLVVAMSYKEREPYFFLRANDLYFRPWA